MPTVGQPVPGYYYDQFTDTLRPIIGNPGPKGDPGNANVTVSPNAPAVAGKAGDLWVQTTTTPWTAPAPMPWGIIAYKMLAGSFSLSTTLTQAIALTNVPLLAGRLYVFTITMRAATMTANGRVIMRTPGASVIANTTLGFEFVFSVIAGDYGGGSYSMPFTVTADANYTINVQMSSSTGTGTALFATGSSVRVEDIGPNRGSQ